MTVSVTDTAGEKGNGMRMTAKLRAPRPSGKKRKMPGPKDRLPADMSPDRTVGILDGK
jgi:hypothetical protein